MLSPARSLGGACFARADRLPEGRSGRDGDHPARIGRESVFHSRWESSDQSERTAFEWALEDLLDRVAPVFDWVILDSAPLLPVADSSFLADLVDGVLLVVRAGQTPAETAQRACQELQGRNVVGVVLNAVGPQDAYGAYYSSAYGYGYGYGHSVEPKSAQI